MDALYVLRSTQPIARETSYRILPDGCIDLVLDLSADADRSFLIGAATGPGYVELHKEVGFLGVRLRPGGLAGFHAVAAHELTNTRVPLDLLWGRSAVFLVEGLQAERSWRSRVARLEAWLLERQTGPPVDRYVYATVQLLRH